MAANTPAVYLGLFGRRKKAQEQTTPIFYPSWFVEEDDINVADVERASTPRYARTPQALKREPGRRFNRFEEGYVTKQVVYIQKNVRRFLARKYFDKRCKEESAISSQSFVVVVDQIVSMKRGWNKLLCHLLFSIVVFLFIYLVAFSSNPSPRSVEQTVNGIFDDVTYEVQEAEDLYEYMRQLSAKIYVGDMNVVDQIPQACLDAIANCSGSFPDNCFQMSKESGYLDNMNRVVFGLAVGQRRYQKLPCSPDVFSVYEAEYNRDYCYDETKLATSWENITEIQASADEYILRDAFTYRESIEPPGFYAFVNIGVFNMPKGASKCDIDALQRHQWVDNMTQELCFSLAIENRNGNGLWATVNECFRFDTGGMVHKSRIIASAEMYNTHNQISSFSVLAVYIAFVIGYLIKAALKIHNRGVKRMGTLQILDLCIMALHITVGILFIVIVTRSTSTEHDIRTHHLTSDEFNHQNAFWTIIGDFRRVVLLISTFKDIMSLILLSMAVRTIAFCDFQPELGVISKVLAHAASQLVSFFIVYAFVTIFYGLVGELLLGDDLPEFSSLGTSINSLMFASLSQIEFIHEIFRDYVVQQTSALTIMIVLFFWSYIFISVLLLLNILLSIVVDSFIRLKEERESEARVKLSILESFSIYLHIAWFDWKHYHAIKLRQFWLRCCCRRSGQVVEDDIKSLPSKPEGSARHGTPILTSNILEPEILLQPMRFSRYTKVLIKNLPWKTQPFVFRVEFREIFPTALVDKLLVSMRQMTCTESQRLIRSESLRLTHGIQKPIAKVVQRALLKAYQSQRDNILYEVESVANHELRLSPKSNASNGSTLQYN
mmetsp:Transcript_3621/g.6936  ORF Transcript_3621/g.6936 Transcript_3621/m.6936 type:complete len:834 (-) Transcript_3621:2931-5432(-)